jgi:aminoglycoside phosphotransferase (APT) family kinase protein
VVALLDDSAPLVAALRRSPVTLVHGDLATVNMAIDGEQLVLIDWALATAGPGALDVARFVAGCASVVDASREDLIGWYRAAAGPACDDLTLHRGLLSAVVWLGWNKALDAVENPDPATRARERADLDWWVHAARRALMSGAI